MAWPGLAAAAVKPAAAIAIGLTRTRSRIFHVVSYIHPNNNTKIIPSLNNAKTPRHLLLLNCYCTYSTISPNIKSLSPSLSHSLLRCCCCYYCCPWVLLRISFDLFLFWLSLFITFIRGLFGPVCSLLYSVTLVDFVVLFFCLLIHAFLFLISHTAQVILYEIIVLLNCLRLLLRANYDYYIIIAKFRLHNFLHNSYDFLVRYSTVRLLRNLHAYLLYWSVCEVNHNQRYR